MKRILLVVGISVALASCGGSQKQGGTDSTSAANQTAKESESSVDTNANKTGTENSGTSNNPGAKLIAGSDCGTCHKVDQKVIGPSFQDVAAKYPNTDASVDTLANKIIKGGSGNWGTVPMTPHPGLSMADAQTIVKYVLSLKKS